MPAPSAVRSINEWASAPEAYFLATTRGN